MEHLKKYILEYMIEKSRRVMSVNILDALHRRKIDIQYEDVLLCLAQLEQEGKVIRTEITVATVYEVVESLRKSTSAINEIEGLDYGKENNYMVKLSPQEIKNLMKEAALRVGNARKANSTLTDEEIVDFAYGMAIGILRQTDPDRFTDNLDVTSEQKQ